MRRTYSVLAIAQQHAALFLKLNRAILRQLAPHP